MNDDSRRRFLKSSIALTTGAMIPSWVGFNEMDLGVFRFANHVSTDEFFDSIRAGDMETIKKLLAADENLLNAKDNNGLSGYCVAILEVQPDIAGLLVQSGYESDLHEAALGLDWKRFEAVAETFGNKISDQVNVDHPLGGGTMYAAAAGGAGTNIWRVFAQGGEPNRFNNSNNVTPLQKALRFRDLETAELTAFTLLSNATDPNATLAGDLPPISIAAERGSLDIIEMLVRRGADVNVEDQDGRTCLEIAESEMHDGVTELLENHEKIPRTNSTFRYSTDRDGKPCDATDWQGVAKIEQLRFVGASHANIEQVQQQLKQDKRLARSVATTREAAVEAGAHMGNKPIVELLLSFGAPYSLPTAVMMGDLETAKRYLDANPERIHERGAHGFALLWYPVIGRCDLAMTELLLDRGAKVEEQSQMGTTALHWASLGGENIELIELLIENGANVNRVGRKFGGKRRTPLQMAKEPAIRRLLESKGAKPS